MSQVPSNPYESPSPSASAIDQAGPSAETVQLLSSTRPWVLMFGVLGLIFAGITLLMAAFSSALFAQFSGAMATFMMVMYVLMSLFYIIPSYWLLRYSGRIAHFRRVQNVASLNEAVAAQKSFWKFLGITFLVFMGIYFVGFILMLATGGTAVFQPQVQPGQPFGDGQVEEFNEGDFEFNFEPGPAFPDPSN